MSQPKKNHKKTVVLLVLLTAYCLMLMNLIILKDLSDTNGEVHVNMRKGVGKANFTPFKTILYYGTLQEDLPTGIQNLGGNIVLFIPVGFLLAALLKLRNAGKLILFSFLISLAFELAQLITGYGTCDVDDLLLNSIGGFSGYLLYRLFIKLIILFRQ